MLISDLWAYKHVELVVPNVILPGADVYWAGRRWYWADRIKLEYSPDPDLVEAIDREVGMYPIDTRKWVDLGTAMQYWPKDVYWFFKVTWRGRIGAFPVDLPLANTRFWVYNKQDIRSYLLRKRYLRRIKRQESWMDAKGSFASYDHWLEQVKLW